MNICEMNIITLTYPRLTILVVSFSLFRIAQNLISFPEAVLGSEVEVPYINGSTIKLKIEPGTSSGESYKSSGWHHNGLSCSNR